MANTLQKDVILNLEISDSDAVTSIGQLIKRMDELKAQQRILNEQQKDLNQQVKRGEITEAEYAAKLKEKYNEIGKVEVQMKMTKESLSAYQKELKNNVVQEKAAEDSIEAMRARLANMRKEYEQLSKAERDNPMVGEKQLANIKSLTDELKELEKQQGDTRRNVGNYASMWDASSESLTRFGDILGGIFGGNGIVGKAATVVVGFGRSLKEMSRDASDMTSTIMDSATKMGSGSKVLEDTAASINQVGAASEETAKTVQGFGKALYETEDSEKKAAEGAKTVAAATGGISGTFQKAGVAAKAFGKQLLALLANPFVAAFSAIVVVLMKLVDQFKKNDDAMTALQKVFAAFKPILDVVTRAFQAIVDVLGKALNGIGEFMAKVMSLIPGLNQYAEAEQDVVVATDNLEEAERKYTVNHSKREKEISELQAKAAESEKYSYTERRKFMEEAAKLEGEDLKESKANAEEKLRIRRQEMALNMGFAEFNSEVYAKMSDDMKNELADLEAMVNNADKAYSDGMRSINKRMNTFIKQEDTERKQRQQAAAAAAKERKSTEEEVLKNLESMWLNSIKNMEDKEYALTRSGFENQIKDLKKRLETEKNLTVKAKKAINTQITLLEADLQIKLGEIREKYRKDQYKKELEDAKKYYTNLFKSLETEDAKLQINLELNRLDTKLLLAQLEEPLKEAQKVLNNAMNDLDLPENQIMAKYKLVFDKNDIDTADGGLAALKQLIAKYQSDVMTEQVKFENNRKAVMNSSLKEEERIRMASVKDTKEAEDKKWSLERKHQDLLDAMQRENDLELYRNDEVKKAEIMQQAAEQRLKIAKDEYNRLLEERNKYSDEELAYMYGSVAEYDNLLEESSLNVQRANREVEQSIRDVTKAEQEEKIKMIDSVSKIADAIGQVAAGFQSLFETLADDNAKYSEFATAMAMVQILTSAAIATAQAVQAAIQAGGFTGPAAPVTVPVFVAQMIGIVTSSIASAISLLKQAKESKSSTPQFATGGLVGNKTTHKTDDKIDAKLSEGEYVIKSEVVAKYGVPFFDLINYGKKMFPTAKTAYAEGGVVSIPQSAIDKTEVFPMDEFKSVMVEAMTELQPVVSVKEITKAQKRVAIKETISKVK